MSLFSIGHNIVHLGKRKFNRYFRSRSTEENFDEIANMYVIQNYMYAEQGTLLLNDCKNVLF